MPVDKDKLFQSLFGVFKKSHCGKPAGKVQALCVAEWKQIRQKCKQDDSLFEAEVKAVMAREQATIRKGNILNYLSKGPSTPSSTITPPPRPTSSTNSPSTSASDNASDSPAAADRAAGNEGPESQESDVDDPESEGLARRTVRRNRKKGGQNSFFQSFLLAFVTYGGRSTVSGLHITVQLSPRLSVGSEK
ncbi:uncharacterized protein LOC117653731 [Thrips palmi]|uniref:Uncharacterized protein LOC117653731 n=1 Tax=Thrips palmi TaxID=161013 RepID=A0A6P9ABG3_THRPL|nr:uncharacterized protein LOC117653731 [Thrips palmi]